MGAPKRQGHGAAGGDRRCASCGTIVAADNTARLCSRCLREQRDQLSKPLAQLRDEFFETDEFRSAFESQHIGKVFKAYRNHPRHLQLFGKALNQDLLGRWLGLTQAQVSKLENGKPEQNLETLRNYATVLRIPHRMLWFDFPGESRLDGLSGNGGVRSLSDRRWREDSAVLTGKSAATALIMQAASESTTFGLRHEVSEIQASSMEQIEEEVRRLSDDFVAGDPFDTFVRSRQLRDDIFGLLEKRVLPRQEQALYAYAARTCGYLAAASSDFYGQYGAGADQCRAARRFADVAELPELRAWTLSLHSGIAFWQGNWDQAATLAERASDLAVTRSGMLRATAMHARALARLGNVERLHLVITTSASGTTDTRSDDENGMILFSDMNHLRCVGTANLWAGNSRQAQEQLTRALRMYLSDAPENFAVIATIRADIALSFLDERDVDGASDALSPLLEMEANRRLEGVLRRMRSMNSILQSKDYLGSSAANELSRQIGDFLASAHRPAIDAS